MPWPPLCSGQGPHSILPHPRPCKTREPLGRTPGSGFVDGPLERELGLGSHWELGLGPLGFASFLEVDITSWPPRGVGRHFCGLGAARDFLEGLNCVPTGFQVGALTPLCPGR